MKHAKNAQRLLKFCRSFAKSGHTAFNAPIETACSNDFATKEKHSKPFKGKLTHLYFSQVYLSKSGSIGFFLSRGSCQMVNQNQLMLQFVKQELETILNVY